MNRRVAGWLGPASVALFGLVLRLWHLGTPRTLSFDEVYYAENAWSMLHVGYAQDFVDGAAARIARGNLHDLFIVGQPTQIVHPEAGKWLIAVGESIWGFNAFGWRIAAAAVGALTILVLARLVLRITGSLLLACGAGLLLAIDGLHLTMSRLALLDGFLTFWIVCAVTCLAADRDWVTRHLPSHPRRPWQWAAGVCLGLACGTKWSGVYVLAAFGITVVLWEVASRRSWSVRGVLAAGLPAFGRLVVVALAVYIATWTGWLVNHQVYEDRFGHGYGDEPAWGAYLDHPTPGPLGPTLDSMRSLWHFHEMAYRFHTGDYLASKTHPYQSDAIGWLVQWRPVSAAVDSKVPPARCGAPPDSSCLRQTVLLGNPVIWWSGTLALMACCGAWLRSLRRRERSWWSVPVVGIAATLLPWIPVQDRPIFAFYAVVSLPFLIVGLALVAQAAWAHASTARRRKLVFASGAALVLASIAAAIYFWPVWTYGLLPYDSWRQRMWFKTWV